MYLEHFGLSAPPFQFTASPTALYMSRTHRDCLAALEWGLLHEPSGLTLLIGDTGVGKTTLVCALLARQYREVRAAYLGNPRLGFEELLGSVLSQLGVRGGRANKAAMINALAHFATDLPANERIAILVDEAQALSDDALEDLRLLSNLDRRPGSKASQMVLAGQFELARRLSAAPMRQLNERIGARAVLVALTPLESREYIEHRLHLCGSSIDRLFARRALDHIVRHSAGVPRRINAFCHNALLLGYSSGAKQIRLPVAREAVADYDAIGEVVKQNRDSPVWLTGRARSLGPMLALLGVGAGVISGYAVLQPHPVGHLRSMLAHCSAVQTRSAPAAAIDPRTMLGTTSIEHEEPQPRAGGVRLPTAGRVSAVMTYAPSAAESKPKQRPRFVTVNRGETLGDIALRYTGSARVDSLLRLNPGIVDAGSVHPGDKIYIPPNPIPTDSGTDVE